jgi:8-oxo-dGTP pyrophosphatase MutT (NUDIX family)
MEEIRAATAQYPRFEDGRIDYTNEPVCFVINSVVAVGPEVLLVHRSAHVIAYPNTFSGVSGFIDRTGITLEQHALLELTEELDAPLALIRSLQISEELVQPDASIGREWHVRAALVEFSEKFEPRTNWENKTAAWFLIEEVRKMELMPGFAETFEAALALRNSD